MREKTKAVLEQERDPAIVLHLTLTLLFYHATGQILSAPGRCVPNILERLQPSILDDTFKELISFQSTLSKIYLAPIFLIKVCFKPI
jgi:hypothetical protein